MSEERAPYNIGGQDPEEVLKFGTIWFIRPLNGSVRIETKLEHVQLSDEQEKKLIEFLIEGREETTLLITLSDESSDEIEEEGELEGAPATFLEIEEDSKQA